MKKRWIRTLTLSAAMLLATSAFHCAAEEDAFVVVPLIATETFDPFAYSGNDKIVMHSIYDYLFEYDEDGQAIPCLVENYELSEDGTEYTFYLREDVTFSSGKAFTSDDVLFAYECMAGSDLWSSTVLSVISAMEKVDEYTVVATKGTPYASVLNFLCEYMAIVDSEAYAADPDSFVTSPVGCGAYVLDTYDETTGYVYLKANENYYGGAPEVKNIEVHLPLDSQVALVALENGEVDFALQLSMIDYQIAQTDENLVALLTDSWSSKTVMLIGEPFNSDEYLRKAIIAAINPVNAAIYDGELEITSSTDLYAPLLMGDYAGLVDTLGYDVELAAEYLAQSNYAGEILEINVYSVMEQIAVSMQADLTAIGINVTVNIVDTNTLTSMLLDGTCQITVMDMGVAYSSVQEMMSYFTSSGFYGAAGLVAASVELDAAIAALNDAWDEETLREGTVTAMELYDDLAITSALYPSNFTVIYNKKYDGISAIWGATYCPQFKYLTYAE